MLLRYFYDSALAHASYMVGCQKTGEAIIIDPDRNIAQYLAAAKREKLTIVGTAETHIHADYVSGSRELAEAVGAKIYVSDESPADWKYSFVVNYDHQLLKDGDTFGVGKIKLDVIHTPGHTPESISFLLTDVGGGADKPMGLFTGDFVFVGSTGRPDLLEEVAGQAGSAEPGARDLYRSIQKFLQLPGYLQIWPAHGAGSACGKGLGAIPSSTVGYEKMFNEALQFKSEDEFVSYILSEQPEAPPYFEIMKRVNKHGPKLIGNVTPKKLDASKLAEVVPDFMVVDSGNSKSFAKGHVPGTINIPIKYLATQGGWFFNYENPMYLIADETNLNESLRILNEIGFDNVVGYFDANELVAAGLATESYENQEPTELGAKISLGEVRLIDIRRQAEWDEGHISQAEYIFLGDFDEIKSNLVEAGNEKPIVLQCRTGSRSAIACSILQAAGVKNVINMAGGIRTWKQHDLPVVTEELEPIA